MHSVSAPVKAGDSDRTQVRGGWKNLNHTAQKLSTCKDISASECYVEDRSTKTSSPPKLQKRPVGSKLVFAGRGTEKTMFPAMVRKQVLLAAGQSSSLP